MAKEIITLQLGNFSNFVGAHFWNSQEASFVYDESAKDPEVNHDVLFREGITRQGHITYTPRLVLADLKGGFGNVKLNGNLYDDSGDFEEIENDCKEYVWSENNFSTHVAEDYIRKKKEIKNDSDFAANEIDDNWSDIIQTELHPNSTVMVKEYLHCRTKQDFNLWSQGYELTSHAVFEEFEEKIRFFAEESDCLQGFHIICDSNNGFGGLASGILSHLKDEFFTKSHCVFPLQTPILQNEEHSTRFRDAVTNGLSMSSLYENCTAICPLSLYNEFLPRKSSHREFPYLIYDIGNISHSSAIVSSAIENITLGYRLHDNTRLMADYFNMITPGDRRLLQSTMCLPFPLAPSFTRSTGLYNNLADTLVRIYNDGMPWTNLLPNINEFSNGLIAQAVTLRGVGQSSLQPKYPPEERRFSNNLIYKCNGAEDMLKIYFENQFTSCRSEVKYVGEVLKLHSKFPSMFASKVQWNGKIEDQIRTVKNYTTSSSNGHTSNGRNGDAEHYNISNGCSNNKNMQELHVFKTDYSKVESVPVLTSLQCSSGSYKYLESAKNILNTCRRSMYLEQHKMEPDELDHFVENVSNLHDLYKDEIINFSTDSSSDGGQ